MYLSKYNAKCIMKFTNTIYYNPPPRLVFSNYKKKNGLTIALITSPPTANMILRANLLSSYLAQNYVLDHYF